MRLLFIKEVIVMTAPTVNRKESNSEIEEHKTLLKKFFRAIEQQSSGPR